MPARRQSASSASTSSSASTRRLHNPVSPPLASLSALPPLQAAVMSPASSSSAASKAAPAPPQPARSDSGSSFTTRARSASIQRGQAVLRALARAPEDATPNGSGSNSDEERSAEAGPVPGLTDQPQTPTVEGLSEEAKASGRANREGLRRRGEQNEVERIVGKDAKGVLNKRHKPAKSWEIPRKLFHGSIGFWVLYAYLSGADLSTIVRTMSSFLAIVGTADVIRLNNPAFERVYESVLGALMREAEKKQVNGVVPFLVGVITCLHFFPEDIACVSVMMLSWGDTAASVFGRLFGRYTPPLPSPPFASRKSSAGFLAAVVAGTATAYVFWGTGIAVRGERPSGLSWTPTHAVFGTPATHGPLHSGWTGLRWGFRASPPLAPSSGLGQAASAVFAAAKAQLLPGSTVAAMPLWLLCSGAGLVAGVVEGLELGGVDDNLSLPIGSAIGIQTLLWAWGRLASLWA